MLHKFRLYILKIARSIEIKDHFYSVLHSLLLIILAYFCLHFCHVTFKKYCYYLLSLEAKPVIRAKSKGNQQSALERRRVKTENIRILSVTHSHEGSGGKRSGQIPAVTSRACIGMEHRPQPLRWQRESTVLALPWIISRFRNSSWVRPNRIRQSPFSTGKIKVSINKLIGTSILELWLRNSFLITQYFHTIAKIHILSWVWWSMSFTPVLGG